MSVRRFRCAQALLILAALLPAQSPPDPPSAAHPRSHEDRASQDPPSTEPPPGTFRLLDVSLDLLVAAGSSTERDAVLQSLQGGGHDPRKRGFTLQNLELGMVGEVDRWFEVAAYLITFVDPLDGETVVELEEAFLTTRRLGDGLELEVGTFFTEFGRHNPVHPHGWTWLDQPVILTRAFGPDGMRGPGARLGWHVPGAGHTVLHLGLQNAGGEGMASFLADDEFYGERPVGGRLFTDREVRSFGDLVGLARFEHNVSGTGLQLGASVVVGPNATGRGGDTVIYGADLGWTRVFGEPDDGRFLRLEGEFVGRRFRADDQIDPNDPADPFDDVPVPGGTLRDHGFYAQAWWGLGDGWAVGLRGDWATGSGASYDAAADSFARTRDPFRSDRLRLSPLLAWQASAASRLRLQYNFDDADWLGFEVHSVWLGFEVRIGGHQHDLDGH